jgi:hypothetical protein
MTPPAEVRGLGSVGPGRRRLTVVRWIARVSAAALFLLWGAFFVEHLGWFADFRSLRPASVTMIQGFHLMFLIGLVLGWRFELLGAGLVVAGAVAFFSQTADENFPLFAAVTSLPAFLWFYCGWRSRRNRTRRDAGGGGRGDAGLTPRVRPGRVSDRGGG